MRGPFLLVFTALILNSSAILAAEAPTLMERERSVEGSDLLLASRNEVIATRAGVQVTVGDLVANIDRVEPGKRLTGLRDAKTMTTELEAILTNRIMAKEARRLGLDKTALVATEVAMLEEQVLARRLTFTRLPDLTDAALEAAAREQYAIRKSEFTLPETRNISHIFVSFDGRTKAEALVRALEANSLLKKVGSSFEELAKTFSDDVNTRLAGGVLGDLTLGSGAAMEAEVFAMQSPGLLANPIESSGGYHVIRLNSIKPKRVQGFEEVKDTLMEQIKKSSSRVAREVLVSSLVGKEPFEIDESGMRKFFEIMGSDQHGLFKQNKPNGPGAEGDDTKNR